MVLYKGEFKVYSTYETSEENTSRTKSIPHRNCNNKITWLMSCVVAKATLWRWMSHQVLFLVSSHPIFTYVAPLHPWLWPIRPWQCLYVDYVGLVSWTSSSSPVFFFLSTAGEGLGTYEQVPCTGPECWGPPIRFKNTHNNLITAT